MRPPQNTLAFSVLAAACMFSPQLGFSSEPPAIPGLRLHLDASLATSVVTDGNVVTEWRDDGNNIVFSPSGLGDSVPPVLVPEALNGLPAIQFSNTSLETNSPNALGLSNSVPGLTMFAVAWNTGDGIQNIFRIGANANNVRMLLGRTTGEHRIQGRRLNGDGFQTLSGGTRLYEEWGIDSATVDYENAAAYLFINGIEVASTDSFQTPGLSDPSDSNRFWIGSNHTPAQYWDGYVAEILIYDRALTVAERQEVEFYLADKYGLSYSIEPETISLGIDRAVEVVFDSVANRTYQILHSSNGEDWTALLEDPLEGTGEQINIYFSSDLDPGEFRVVERFADQHAPQTGTNPVIPELNGLRLQLDASNSDTVVLQDGVFVSEWHNARGDEIVFHPADPEVLPFYMGGQIGGRSAVRFGVNRFMETFSPAALSMTNDIPAITIFAVGWNTDGGNQNYVRIGHGASVSALRFMFGRQTTGSRMLGRRDDAGGFQTVAGGPNLSNRWAIESGTVDFANATAFIALNGDEVASSSSFLDGGNTSPTDSNMFRIGNDHASQYWIGDIAEIILFDRALTQAEQNQIGVYLSNKYGIPYTVIHEDEIAYQRASMAKVTFTTEFGNSYQVEMTHDLSTWVDLNEATVGSGFPTSVYLPLEGVDRAFFRVKKLN